MDLKNLCVDCVHWRHQRRNSVMGHCVYPLPARAREALGNGAMQKGIYGWVGEIKSCLVYQPVSAEVKE